MVGGRKDTIRDDQILQVFLESEDPILFTGEVAEAIGFSNQGTLPRLERLQSRGFLECKKGGRVPAWWITEAGREYVEQEREVG